MVDNTLSLMVLRAGGRSLARAMASPRPPLAMVTGTARPLRRRFSDFRLHQQPAQPHQVVGGGYQVPRQAGAVQPTVAGPPEPAHRLPPSKDFLHPLPEALAERIARMSGGAAVDGAGSAAGVLCHMRGHTARAQLCDTIFGVVALVRTQGLRPKAALVRFLQQLPRH